MPVSKVQDHTCADCGVTISGVPVVPWTAPPTSSPTQAQVEKLKPTVFLCTECAEDRGLSFNAVAVGTGSKAAGQTTAPA